MPSRSHPADGPAAAPRPRPTRTSLLPGLVASLALVALLAACQGASKETLAADYLKLAQASDAAYGPLLASLGSTNDPATRAPMLRGLADAEKAYADGLSSLQASGDVKAAMDEVIRLSRERDAAFRAAADAKTGSDQAAALAVINGPEGDAFVAAVARLRDLLGLPPAGTDAAPSTSPTASPSGVVSPGPRGGHHHLAAGGARATTTAAAARSLVV